MEKASASERLEAGDAADRSIAGAAPQLGGAPDDVGRWHAEVGHTDVEARASASVASADAEGPSKGSWRRRGRGG